MDFPHYDSDMLFFTGFDRVAYEQALGKERFEGVGTEEALSLRYFPSLPP